MGATPELAAQAVWLSDLEAGKHVASTKRKLILFYCYVPMALACRDMEQKTFVDPKVQEAIRPYVLVAINLSVNRQLAEKLALFRVPTVFFLNMDGMVLDRAVGYKSPEQMLLYLKRLEVTLGSQSAPKITTPLRASPGSPGNLCDPISFGRQRVQDSFSDGGFQRLAY